MQKNLIKLKKCLLLNNLNSDMVKADPNVQHLVVVESHAFMARPYLVTFFFASLFFILKITFIFIKNTFKTILF